MVCVNVYIMVHSIKRNVKQSDNQNNDILIWKKKVDISRNDEILDNNLSSILFISQIKVVM